MSQIDSVSRIITTVTAARGLGEKGLETAEASRSSQGRIDEEALEID